MKTETVTELASQTAIVLVDSSDMNRNLWIVDGSCVEDIGH